MTKNIDIQKLKEHMQSLIDERFSNIEKLGSVDYGSSEYNKLIKKSDDIINKMHKVADKCPHTDLDGDFIMVSGADVAKCNICQYWVHPEDVKNGN